MSGNDFNLDINNPDDPKVVCMENNPQKIQVYGAMLSLYVTRLVNKSKVKSNLIFYEFPTIYPNASGRSCRTTKAIPSIAVIHPKQLESAIPPSSLSSGEFVGMVADDLKIFHDEIINDHEALKKEQDSYKDIEVIRKLDNGMMQRNYLQIKQDVQDISQSEIERMLNDPGLSHLVVKKG